MFIDWLDRPTIDTLGWTLLHSLWQLSTIAAATAIALTLLRKFSPNLRYLLASAALLLMLATPLATFITLRPASAFRPIAVTAPSERPAILSDDGIRYIERPVFLQNNSTPATPPIAAIPASPTQPWMNLAVAAYFIGVLLLSLRLLAGFYRLHRLRQTATPRPLNPALTKLSKRLRITRTIQLLESAAVEVPTVLGFLRPAILLPATALTGLSPDQLTALLAHELAHIRRFDYFANTLQSLIEVLLFYHPATWWLSARIRQEREHCCDDLAVTITGNPITYAHALAAMESLRTAPEKIPTTLALTARTGALLPRIRRLLGLTPAPTPPLNASSAAIVILLLATLIYLGCNRQTDSPKTSAPPTTAPVDAATENRILNLDPTAPGDQTQISWESRVLIVSNDFLNDFRIRWQLSLPPNSSEIGKDPISAGVIDNWTLSVLLTASQADKHSQTITAPRLVAVNNATAEINLPNPINYIAGFHPKDSTNPQGPWEAESGTVDTGVTLRVKSTASMDGRYVIALPQISVKTLDHMDHAPAPGTPTAKNLLVDVPVISTVATSKTQETMVSIPDGGTLLLDGGVYHSSEITGRLLILMRPRVLPKAEWRDITTEYREDSPANRIALALLEIPVKEFTAMDQPLEKVINLLRDTTNTDIFVNWKALQGAGIHRNLIVSVSLANVSYRMVLTTILAQITAAKVGYTIDDGTITISTNEDLQSAKYQIVRVYDIRDLLVVHPKTATVAPSTIPATLPDNAAPNPERGARLAEIIHTIVSTIAPETWRDNGGNVGTIRELNGLLIINQTVENQRAVQKLLDPMRDANDLQVTVGMLILLVPEKLLDTFPIAWNPPAATAPNITPILTASIDSDTYAKLLDSVEAGKIATLGKPRITLFNAQSGIVTLSDQQNFIAGAHPNDPTNAAGDWVMEVATLTTGISAGIQATVSADHKSVVTDLNFTRRHLQKIVTIPHPAAPPEKKIFLQIPHIDTKEVKTRLSIADGQTTILDAGTVNDDAAATRPANAAAPRHLLILIHPTILEHHEIENPLP